MSSLFVIEVTEHLMTFVKIKKKGSAGNTLISNCYSLLLYEYDNHRMAGTTRLLLQEIYFTTYLAFLHYTELSSLFVTSMPSESFVDKHISWIDSNKLFSILWGKKGKKWNIFWKTPASWQRLRNIKVNVSCLPQYAQLVHLTPWCSCASCETKSRAAPWLALYEIHCEYCPWHLKAHSVCFFAL